MSGVLAFVLVLIAAKVVLQLWLERLNRHNTWAQSANVPPAFSDTVDQATYRKSVEYTLAKSRFRQIELIFGTVVLVVILLSGVLPRIYEQWQQQFGNSAAAEAAFLFTTALAISLLSLPLDWHEQFRLEERFGFNTTTTRLWWVDRFKGLVLSIVLGFPLLWLVLILVARAGASWWLWAWAIILGFQLLVSVLAPVLILPLFNKFTPLPEGSLRDRLIDLAKRTSFKASSIQLMDGSKRSLHSNAFFIGFGRFRKIVLFDTLVAQLAEPELEAVLAHEIGHYKKKHIPKMLLWSAASLLVALAAVAWLAKQQWFFHAFGFPMTDTTVALLLFGLLSGVFTFWFSPVIHWWSRRYEYQADGFAAGTSDPDAMIGALRKLSVKNLSNLTPHPFYSGFYYSHPTLLERESAIRALAGDRPATEIPASL